MSNRVYVPGLGYVDSSSSGKPTWDPGRHLYKGGAGAKLTGFEPDLNATGTGATTSTGKQSSMAAAYGVDAGDPIVSFPNLNWRYSSADVYGSQDPSDPSMAMWNFGLNATDAEKAFDDDDLVPSGLRDVLDKIAKSIHPLKGGRSIWEELVAASALGSQRGEYVTPYAILRRRYLSGDATETRDGEETGSRSYSSGGGGYGGGGGATSQRIDLASPSQAQALLTQFMQASVGRDPKPSEVRKFVELLQGYQTNNPTVVSAAGNTVTQTGGVDPSMVAQEFVETLPDYTESQADSYYRTFMQALLGGAA